MEADPEYKRLQDEYSQAVKKYTAATDNEDVPEAKKWWSVLQDIGNVKLPAFKLEYEQKKDMEGEEVDIDQPRRKIRIETSEIETEEEPPKPKENALQKQIREALQEKIQEELAKPPTIRTEPMYWTHFFIILTR